MKKLFSGIKWFEDTLTSAFLSIVVLITLANVVARYVMKSSIPWAQEISGFFASGIAENLLRRAEFLDHAVGPPFHDDDIVLRGMGVF